MISAGVEKIKASIEAYQKSLEEFENKEKKNRKMKYVVIYHDIHSIIVEANNEAEAISEANGYCYDEMNCSEIPPEAHLIED